MKHTTDSGIWFSYKQRRYHANKIPTQFRWIKRIIPQNKLFKWSDEPEIWDWENCHLSIVGMDKDCARVVARRQKILDRTDHLSGDKIWLMLGVVATNVSDIKPEDYNEPVEHNPPNHILGASIKRWAFHMTVKNSGDKKHTLKMPQYGANQMRQILQRN